MAVCQGKNATSGEMLIIIIIITSGLDVILSVSREGYFLAMISESQVYVVNPGDTVTLECNFHADEYDLFQRPVLWRKEQLNEDKQINALSSINPPFVSTNRFDVNLANLQSRYQLELVIANATPEDTGNYTCEVRGTHSVVIVSVVHQLFVRAQIDNVTLVVKQNFVDRRTAGKLGGHEEKKQTSVVRFIEGQPHPIKCVVHGGTPSPSVTLFVDRKDVTNLFQLRSNVDVTGTKGLRRLQSMIERVNQVFTLSQSDDGATLKCVATVPGLSPVYHAIKLDVDYEPKITCFSNEAQLGDVNVHVTCEVRAKPSILRSFWQLNNGTRLANTEVVDDYWSISKGKQDDITETVLYIRVVRAEMFRKYTFVAENSVGSRTQDVELVQFSKSQVKQPLSDAASTDMLAEGVSPILPIAHLQATPLARTIKHSKKFSSSSSSSSSIFFLETKSSAHSFFNAFNAELVALISFFCAVSLSSCRSTRCTHTKYKTVCIHTTTLQYNDARTNNEDDSEDNNNSNNNNNNNTTNNSNNNSNTNISDTTNNNTNDNTNNCDDNSDVTKCKTVLRFPQECIYNKTNSPPKTSSSFLPSFKNNADKKLFKICPPEKYFQHFFHPEFSLVRPRSRRSSLHLSPGIPLRVEEGCDNDARWMTASRSGDRRARWQQLIVYDSSYICSSGDDVEYEYSDYEQERRCRSKRGTIDDERPSSSDAPGRREVIEAEAEFFRYQFNYLTSDSPLSLLLLLLLLLLLSSTLRSSR